MTQTDPVPARAGSSGPRIIAIDLGTTNAKVALFDGPRLTSIARGQIATSRQGTGRFEQDPGDWLATIANCVRDVLARQGQRTVDAISLTAQSDSLVTVGDDGQALGPCLLWMDERGAVEASRFEAELGRTEIHRRTGLRSALNYTAAKAAWIKGAEPERYARTRWFLQPKDYLHLRLTGVPATEPSSASRTLLYDLDGETWWADGLAAFGLSASGFPAVVPSASSVGGLTREASRLLGLPAALPVVIGAADRAAEALGLGIGGREAMISTGTATGVALAGPRVVRPHDDRITTPAHAIADETLSLLSIPTSGAAVDWLAGIGRFRGRDPIRSITGLAATSDPGARGVTAVPSFGGARSFRWERAAHGALLGIDLDTSLADLARALMEGIAFEVALCMDVFEQAGQVVIETRLTGGGFASPFACQLMVDVTGRPAYRAGERHAALAGAMVLASQVVGVSSDPRAFAVARRGRGRRFEPRPEAQSDYTAAARRYRDAADAVIDLAGKNEGSSASEP
jgi:xylulokinase